jgi:hypothetical protein
VDGTTDWLSSGLLNTSPAVAPGASLSELGFQGGMEQFNLTWEQIEAVLEFVVRNLDRTTHPELPA